MNNVPKGATHRLLNTLSIRENDYNYYSVRDLMWLPESCKMMQAWHWWSGKGWVPESGMRFAPELIPTNED